MNRSISILAEIPEELHQSLRDYLEAHPTWDIDQVFAMALSLFLLQSESYQTQQSSEIYRACARVYLETLFQQSDL